MRHEPWKRDNAGQPPRARGSVDVIDRDGNRLRLAGWLLHPRIPCSTVTVEVDGQTLGTFGLRQRDDVLKVFPDLPPGIACGFDVSGTLPDSSRSPGQLNLYGGAEGQRAIYLPWTVPDSPGLGAHVAPPPAALMQRVSGNSDPASFATAGFQAAVDLLSVAHQHGALSGPVQLLDWGCGCARVTAQLVRMLPAEVAVSGCDLDAEAVAWCRDAIPQAEFAACGVEPPLPYADSTFHVVVSSSVMTHLDRHRQLSWLAEIRRVLKPGGLFIASTHGEFAADFHRGMTATLDKAGILDDYLDPALDGIAPPGYYRGVFQLPRYTAEHWSPTLPVIDQIPAGLLGYQDLVVLRKP